MSRLLALACMLAGCADRAIEPAVAPQHDLAVTEMHDLAMLVDAAQPVDAGKRRLGEPCTADVQCLSDKCLTPMETRGEFDKLCGATCDHANPCAEGTCLSYDFDLYWCLRACDPQLHNADCPPRFVCCENGVSATCVNEAALTCLPI